MKLKMTTLICCALLVACSVRTPIEVVKPPENPEILKSADLLLRNFSVKPGLANGTATINHVKHAAKDYLIAKDLFKSVAEAGNQNTEPPLLTVDVQLTDVRIVRTGVRVLTGFFAGRSHIKMVASIIDKDGKQIAQKELFGAPNSLTSSLSYGQNDRSLPARMGYLLGDYVISEAYKYCQAMTSQNQGT